MPAISFLNRTPAGLERLHKYNLPAAEVERLKTYIRRASDRELFKANPLQLAQSLGWETPHTLDVLTLAAAEDLLRLEWETFCPGCSGGLQHSHTLGEIQTHQACACGWQGEIVLDQAVAVQASLDEHVRRLRPEKDDPQFRQEVDTRLGRLMAINLINRPLFREMLGEQTLPENQSLGVEHLAIFFSDLKGSTALYQRLSDATAYQLVREHFNVIFAAVEKHGGSAVKTIGDGVMGTFGNNAAALRGIVDSFHGMQDLNQRAGLQGEDRLSLKMGLHAGPCIVVTLNHRLDYFGSTVNIASRLSHLAEGGDLLFSQSVLEDAGVQAEMSSLGKAEQLHTTLRGVLQPVQVYRLVMEQA